MSYAALDTAADRRVIHVICLPPAGASVAVFASWAGLLPSPLSLGTIELPGRGLRLNEAPLRRFGEMVDFLLRGVEARFPGPCLLVGQSFGGWLALHLADALLDSPRSKPLGVLLASAAPPSSLSGSVPLRTVDETVTLLAAAAQKRERPLVPEALLRTPALVADLEAARSIRNRPLPAPLPLPMCVYQGTDDLLVDAASTGAWADASDGPVRFRSFAGAGHFLFDDPDSEPLGQLVSDLIDMAAGRDPVTTHQTEGTT